MLGSGLPSKEPLINSEVRKTKITLFVFRALIQIIHG
jgi:hypothetical protein